MITVSFGSFCIGYLGDSYDSSSGYVGDRIFSSTGFVLQSNSNSSMSLVYGGKKSPTTQTYVGGFTCSLYRSGVPCDLYAAGYHFGDSFPVMVAKYDIEKCFIPSDLETNFILGIVGVCLLIVFFIMSFCLMYFAFDTHRNSNCYSVVDTQIRRCCCCYPIRRQQQLQHPHPFLHNRFGNNNNQPQHHPTLNISRPPKVISAVPFLEANFCMEYSDIENHSDVQKFDANPMRRTNLNAHNTQKSEDRAGKLYQRVDE